MTKRTTISLIWVVIVSLLLGGAFLITARNSSSRGVDATSGYVH